MVRPADQEMTSIKKIVYFTHRFPEEGPCHAMPCHSGPHGEAPGLVRRQRDSVEDVGKKLCFGFLQEGTDEAG